MRGYCVDYSQDVPTIQHIVKFTKYDAKIVLCKMYFVMHSIKRYVVLIKLKENTFVFCVSM